MWLFMLSWRLLFEEHQVSYDNQNYNGHLYNNSMKNQKHYKLSIIVCYLVTPFSETDTPMYLNKYWLT